MTLLEYTDMLLDVRSGVCRICANKPSIGYHKSSCVPRLPPESTVRDTVDPFDVLPANGSTQVQRLIFHCTSLSHIPSFFTGSWLDR